MPRHRLYLAALLSSLLGGWLAVDIWRLAWSNQAPSTVYSFAALRTLVEHAPAHWLGRTVVVRALAEPCPWWGEMARLQHCAGQSLALLGTGSEAPAAPLPLIRPAPSPLWTVLRRLPWLGDLLPQPTPVDPLVPALYRVRLFALPAGAGSGARAMLLAVAPLARQEG